MKQRVISGLFGLAVVFVVLYFLQTALLEIAVILVALLCIGEILRAIGCKEHVAFCVFCLLYGMGVILFSRPLLISHYALLNLCFALGVGIFLIIQHNTLQFGQAGFAFFASMGISYALSTLVLLRNLYPQDAQFYVLMAVASPWLTDSGAYFIGCLCGKHKMSPVISPKKTVEGAIGGVITCLLLFMLLGYGYAKLFGQGAVHIQYGVLFFCGLFCSVASIFGDLLASVIKRQCGIKDFGKIFPGHGGMMDRFDSVLFAAPLFFAIVRLFPVIVR